MKKILSHPKDDINKTLVITNDNNPLGINTILTENLLQDENIVCVLWLRDANR